jgi:hypothetical protein
VDDVDAPERVRMSIAVQPPIATASTSVGRGAVPPTSLSMAISNPEPVRATKRRPPSWRRTAVFAAI